MRHLLPCPSALWRENMASKLNIFRILSASLLVIGLAGCSISHHKDDRGNGDKDVDIRTPFGSLSVHEGSNDIKETGLQLYPGATVKKDMSDDHHGSANVHISSSLFGLKV